MMIISENKVALSVGLIAEHGFCAYLETDDLNLLWDTGQGFCLAQNATRLGIQFGQVKTIALSHGHFDHTGGLVHALESAKGGDVFCHPACLTPKKAKVTIKGQAIEVPVGMPKRREEYEALGARFRFVEDHLELAPGVHFFADIPQTTDFETLEPGFTVMGPDGPARDTFADDAALAVITGQGVSVLLGCAHRGLINTLAHVQARLNVDRIHSVFGGTHLMDRTPEQVRRTVAALRELGVEKIGAGHCTGLMNEMALAQALPDRFVFIHAGFRADL